MTQRVVVGRLESGFDPEAKCLIIQTQETGQGGSQAMPAVLLSGFWVDVNTLRFDEEFFAADEGAIIFVVH